MQIEIPIKIKEFIEELSKRDSTNLVYNPYKNFTAKNNLSYYLSYLLNFNEVEYLLLGEAGGYGGMRWTGLAFTSGHIIAKSRIFSSIRKYLDYSSIQDKKENSASIVYSFFNRYPALFTKVLIWNSLCFHPHIKNNTETNRTPNKDEIKEGQYFLIKLIKIFNIKKYYPIGNIAEKSLNNLIKEKKIPFFKFIKVRHPAHGGKEGFLFNMKQIFKIKEKKIRMNLNHFLN